MRRLRHMPLSLQRRRCSLIVLALLAAMNFDVAAVQAQKSPLTSRQQAASLGLERAWFAQVPLDPARSRMTTWYLYHDRLYGVTDSGIVAALDAETGETLWAKQVGKPGYSAFGPGANAAYLGIVSGAKLYLLDRHDGRVVWVRELGSAPASGPALSDDYAYVALVTGRIEGYKLDDPLLQPWYYQSKGRTYLRPTVTGRIVSWPTADGYLYVGRADEPGVLFRLETNDDIVTSPAEQEPYLYIASLDGYLYCVHELTGREQWRYSTGYPIASSPAVVGKTVFVASFEPALHAVDAESGEEQWMAHGLSHFAARSQDRVYASDRYGNLLILELKTGRTVGRLPVAEGVSTLVNDHSDRIFLVNDRGFVQCLRETSAEQPTYYREQPAPLAKEDAAAEDAKSPFAVESDPEEPAVEGPADEANPFAPVDEPAPADEPADEPAEDDNPFGAFEDF